MIKINLLGERRARRARAAKPPPPLMLISILALFLACGVGYLFLHRPLATDVEDLKGKNKDLGEENTALKNETRNSRAIRAAFEEELGRQQAIQRLKNARVSPAWLMFELSNVLTPGHQPQVTPEMQAELKDNPNRPWQEGWDPKHVWITAMEEKAGHFVLKGAGQSKGDVDELGLRLRASMFFDQVSPTETDDVSDKDTGITFHKFVIEGKVRY